MTHLLPVSTLSGWTSALSTGLWIPLAFRLVAFAFESILAPLKSSASLTGCLLGKSQTSLGLLRYARMRCNWVGCPLYTGVVGVPVQLALRS
ncbi:hypothetical protein IQ229_07850 [Nostoc cf. edaphicum LEGE 07299]|uniref:Secreted protein n=1 Tax=Nostoc cf. edaphicum LEGE 07299 TaxID=2777974 RepID=A0ABR9TWW0_9NOSO|nr:hypothetical protein [Nostoc edaphicum]MBE9104856.1 hypothetical protein [Nostoc cf. edaphicum LEGE 07299]